MPNKEVISSQNDVERLEIREQTKSKSEAKWKYKVRCVCMFVHTREPTLREGCVLREGDVRGWGGLGGVSGGVQLLAMWACPPAGSAVQVCKCGLCGAALHSVAMGASRPGASVSLSELGTAVSCAAALV